MGYKITDLAKQNPVLNPLPLIKNGKAVRDANGAIQYASGSFVGIGGEYLVNDGANCPTCGNSEPQAKANVIKSFREATPQEYEVFANDIYAASGGIPNYLIAVAEKEK